MTILGRNPPLTKRQSGETAGSSTVTRMSRSSIEHGQMNKSFFFLLPDSGPLSLPPHHPNSYHPKEPPHRTPESLVPITLPLRGPLANSSGSPHLGNMIHPPMPPSCIMEELQRAFAIKNRQERWACTDLLTKTEITLWGEGFFGLCVKLFICISATHL